MIAHCKIYLIWRSEPVPVPFRPLYNSSDLLTFREGGLIVLSLFLRQWGIAQCAQVFDRVTRQLFRAGHKRASAFHSFRRFLKCWLSDGCYDVKIFENLLKENFGDDRRVFDSLQPNSGVKVAVTATTISNAFPYVFSNYNGVGVRHPDCGKSIL